MGSIGPCQRSWVSPVVLVTKEDGSTRVCMDYRKVNRVTLKGAYPIPRIDDTLDALREQNTSVLWICILDTHKMNPKDIHKTALLCGAIRAVLVYSHAVWSL